MLYIFVEIFIDPRSCHTESCDSRHIVCTGAHSTLLSATEDLRDDLHFFIDIQKSNTLWSVDLVSADCKKIDAHLFRVNAVFTKSLDGIYMIKSLRAFFVNHLRNFFYRHHGTDFVIYKHGRNHNRIRAQNCFQCTHLYFAFMIYRKIGDFKSLFLQKRCRLADCCMFYRCNNNVISVSLVCQCTTDQCKVIRFCTT